MDSDLQSRGHAKQRHCLCPGCGNDAIFRAKIMRASKEMRYQSENFLCKQLKNFKQIRNIANIEKISSLCSRKNY